MKTFNKIMKAIAAIAAIIGIVYVIATYGDRIVAWANNLLDRFFDKRTCFFDIDEQMEEDMAEEAVEAPAADVACEG
jgi:hypothetical protein